VKRGQTLVEFAIALPILLTLLIGSFFVGQSMLVSSQLQHAANEGAVAAAQHSGAGKCDQAEADTRRVLGHAPDRFLCTETGPLIEVRIGDDLPVAIPFIDAETWPINVVGRSIIRTGDGT
jgi:hypothetical protein